MKALLAAILLLRVPSQGNSQGNEYKSLDELGWQMADFSIPEGMTDLDTGAVTYLVTINDTGNVLRVRILGTTCNPQAEKKWRRTLKDCSFINAAVTRPTGKRIAGTMTINRRHCNTLPEGNTLSPAEQTDVFRDP